MKRTFIDFRRIHDDQSGAALIMVILISLLLVTAIAAVLSAVGASSRNNSDALSEAKAYWAAESGLNAVINVLRHHKEGDGSDVEYGEAAGDSDLSTWLAYDASHRVVVNSDASYEISVSDPDSAATSTTFTSTGSFAKAVLSDYVNPINYPPPTPVPSPTVSPEPSPTPTPSPTPLVDYTKIEWLPAGDTVDHTDANPDVALLGTFRVTTVNAGGAITPSLLRVDYRMSAPRTGVRSFRGQIVVAGGTKFQFDSATSNLAGGPLQLCADETCATATTTFPFTAPASPGFVDIPVYVRISPTEPWRLKVVATGYGPNGARKQLEGIIQKNFFNDWGVANAITLVGRTTPGCMVWDPGTSNEVLIDGGQSPSVGVADTTGLDQVVNPPDPMNGDMEPPPAVYGDELPNWLQDVNELHDLVMSLKDSARKKGRIFTNRSPTDAEGWGNFDANPKTGEPAGSGITFCDGDCTMKGNVAGGGILVITGTFYTQGNPKFRGLVLAVGPYRSEAQPGGIYRGGGGKELFTGGVVIAPYFPENLAAGFGCPRYIQDGGPGDTTNAALEDTFNGTETVTNVMRGIAEK